MRARIFNILVISILLTYSTYANAVNTNLIVSGPLAEFKVISSACGDYLLLNAKNKHVHLSSKDIDVVGINANVADNSLCYVNSINNQNIPQPVDDADRQVKNYSKSYTVDAGTRLNINNRYGKVTVNTWNKNEFKVDVQMQVITDKADDGRRFLDRISISDSKQGQTVSFKTNIDKDNQNDLFSSKTSSRKIEINYVVYMPAQNALIVTNKYGNIDLPDLAGKVEINCSYGDLQARSLNNSDNEIQVSYGDARIGSLRATDLDIAYGSLVLGSVDKLRADMKYSSAKIGKINTSGDINIKYGGGLNITSLDENMTGLLVNAKYASVKVGLSDNADADFDVTVNYGSFNYGTHSVSIYKAEASDNKSWSPTKNYKGRLGKGNVAKIININSSYSSVKFE